MSTNRSSLSAAILGVVLGVLIASLFFHKETKSASLAEGKWKKILLVLDQVDKNYVDTIDVKAITDAAIEAALKELDPHSIYLPPSLRESTEEELSGKFEGIGIQFNVPDDTAIVIETISGGPAEKVGMMAGDRLLKVGDTDIAGVKFPQDSMVRRMKGPAGTKVHITAARGSDIIPFEITRDKIPVHCIDAHFMANDTTGYIKLSKFTRSTFAESLTSIIDLLSSGMTHLVFDVRGNSGGYFDQALLLSNIFLKKDSEIVYIQGLHRKMEKYKADGKGPLQDIKLTILIDESSASSSEIFAGAIQDNDRGTIVGRRSFGKGLVQEPVNFTDGSGVRITVARFHTPSGRCIQKPYGDYQDDIFNRYTSGELTSRDSIKTEGLEKFYTVGGREVYGGGGIIPDVFVPMDTTSATRFYVACTRKATAMRFASSFFDKNRNKVSQIDSFNALEEFFASANVEASFLRFAAEVDKIRPSQGEWQQSKEYMLPQIKALIGRYSKLGENAYYQTYLPIDNCFQAAIQ